MEGSEESAKNDYASYDEYPDLQQIARDEDEHEQRLIALINEERLEYMGSVVLGLNDAFGRIYRCFSRLYPCLERL